MGAHRLATDPGRTIRELVRATLPAPFLHLLSSPLSGSVPDASKGTNSLVERKKGPESGVAGYYCLFYNTRLR